MATRTFPTLKERLQATTTFQRFCAAVVLLVAIGLFVAFFVFEKQIFQMLEPAVNFIRNSDAGMAVLSAIMAATCIFPLFGYGVITMICGYVYGIPKGFIPAFVGDIVGASFCFWLYRFAFNKYINRKFKDNIEYKEVSKAINKDGFYLDYWRFIAATALSTPRLFLLIFIGHNMTSLAKSSISGRDRALNWTINFVGLIIAVWVGWYIYRHASRRIQRINAGLVAEEGEDEDEVEVAARMAAQERLGREEQQHNSHYYDDALDPVDQLPVKDRHTRQDTNDTVIALEEMEGSISNPNQSQGSVSITNDSYNPAKA
ncbi:Tlg2-vesicle protein [Mortierella sp. NVP85]|nr:Tlg2-vesicle protein [Mortierella sp. NVP85]